LPHPGVVGVKAMSVLDLEEKGHPFEDYEVVSSID